MMSDFFIYVTTFGISWHRLLHPPIGGLLIYFLPVEENKSITLVRSVILFGRNKPQRTGVKGVYAELLCETSASHVLCGKKS